MAVVLEHIDEIEKSRKYLVENISKLTGNHGDEFVAIVDGELVFFDKNLDSVLAKLKDSGKTNRALIEYISSKHLHVIV